MEPTIWRPETPDWAGRTYGLLAPRVNVQGRLALVILGVVIWAFGWLLWRAYCVIQTPNEILVDKLGLDIPPPPVVTLEEIGAKEIQISWKSSDAGASIQEHHVEVNGRLAGVTKKQETAAAVYNLRPYTFYEVRIFSVSTGRFQTPSAILRVRTRVVSEEEADNLRNDAGPAIRALVPRLPPTPSTSTAPSMAREPSGGPLGRRGTTGRRSSPAGQNGESSGTQTDGSTRGGDEETDDILQELSQKFRKIQEDIEATEVQYQEEEKAFEQQVKELEAKRDELKQALKQRDEASNDLKKQVHKAEAANRAALSEKTKKERLLEQRQNARRKRKEEMTRWEEQTATMTEEMEGIKTQQAAIERRKQSEIQELQWKIAEEQQEVANLEEDNREKSLQIKALEEERQQLNAEEETDESREADRLEKEKDLQWRDKMNNLTASYARLAYELQQAHLQYNIARERLTMYENQRRATMVSFAPPPATDMDALRRGMKPVRRSRQTGSYGSSVSSPRTAFGAEPYNMNTHFTNAVNTSPTTFGPSFFNFQNGMTLMVPSDNPDSLADEPEMTTATPMSPRADALLPTDLLGDESTDELSQHDEPAPPRPASTKSQGNQDSKEGSDAQTPSSPGSYSSPREDFSRLAEYDRKFSATSPEERKVRVEEDDGSNTAKKSTMSNLFSFNRQRGKTLADQPPLLGSLKAGQSQSFPRNFDGFDPSAQPRRRLSQGGSWAFPGSSLLARGHSVREGERLPSTGRNFAGLRFGKPAAATQNYDPFAPEQILRTDGASSRPSSVYSFDKLPRPSAESQFHAWSIDKGMRNSPLAPDWSSSISRNHSRRPSIYGSTSNLSLVLPGDEDFLQPRREHSRPLQAPIGTRPVSSQRPATPKLNPAAPSFTMLFGKSREKAKEKAKAKEAEKREKEDKASEAESMSPSESRQSRDTHSIAATASTHESRDSLERTTSGFSGTGTPSESTPSKPTFISKITRKASSNKFGSWKAQGGIFSRKDGKEASTPTGEQEDEHLEFISRSYESMATTPVEDRDKKASRTSLSSWNFMRKSKKGARDDLAASEVSESSEKAFSEAGDEHDEEH